jgi:hypothetical protein
VNNQHLRTQKSHLPTCLLARPCKDPQTTPHAVHANKCFHRLRVKKFKSRLNYLFLVWTLDWRTNLGHESGGKENTAIARIEGGSLDNITNANSLA